MSLVRRSFAAISALLLLQLMLLGSGTLCVMHDARTSDATMMAGMAGQKGSHETGVSQSNVSDVPMSPADCRGGGDQGGCRLPFAPGQCSSMTTCTISATAAATIAPSETRKPGVLAVPLYALGHRGPTFAPELPPPRA
jgi:hypothetical protein